MPLTHISISVLHVLNILNVVEYLSNEELELVLIQGNVDTLLSNVVTKKDCLSYYKVRTIVSVRDWVMLSQSYLVRGLGFTGPCCHGVWLSQGT